MNTSPEVSVVVLTYNSQIEQLEATLKSIICQKDVMYELIISDDGSNDLSLQQIKECIKAYPEVGLLITSARNTGTVSNTNRGITPAKGRYTKLLSPGDYFTDEFALKKWVEFNDNNGIAISFCNYIPYTLKDELVDERVLLHPINVECFKTTGNIHSKIINRIVFHDYPIGATLLFETGLLKKYIERMEHIIIYCEDECLSWMILDGKDVLFFPDVTIAYEYGGGVSTNGDKKWNARIERDIVELRKEILRQEGHKIGLRMNLFLRAFIHKGGVPRYIRFILFPEAFLIWIKRKMRRKKINIIPAEMLLNSQQDRRIIHHASD